MGNGNVCPDFESRGVSIFCLIGESGADPGFFLGGGALVSSNKPHSFFCRIPVVLENRRSSRGGGAHPLHPPPRSAPGNDNDDDWYLIATHTYRRSHEVCSEETSQKHVAAKTLGK